MSSQTATANAVVAAFNAMDVDAIASYRSPDCQRILLPSSLGLPSQDNATYIKSLHQLKAIFKNFSLTIDEIMEDTRTRTMCLWLTARADTDAGLYENEYVWMWNLDETGTKITRSKEYSDSAQAKEFFPKLQEAMKQRVVE